MSFYRFVLFVGCSSVVTCASAASPCAPEWCAGSCFAGRCLLGDSQLDDANSFSIEEPLPRQPLQLLESEAVGPNQPPGLGFQSTGVSETKAQELSYELQRAEAHEALLQAKNEQLTQQLERWKVAGYDIASRDAKVFQLLGAQAMQPKATAANALPTEPLPGAMGSATQPSMLQRAASHVLMVPYVSHSYIRLLFMAIGTIFMLAGSWKAFRFMQRLRKGEESLVSNRSSPCMQPVLRALGLTQYKVEVSEIHLGSLFSDSNDICINFRMGNGTECWTKVLKNGDGAFLRFNDVLELSVCGSDAPSTICITDRRGDLAHVELPAAELVRLATRPHQEYFRTELTATRALGEVSDQRPYVAMRLRNILAIPVAAKAGEGRAYGSFAV